VQQPAPTSGIQQPVRLLCRLCNAIRCCAVAVGGDTDLWPGVSDAVKEQLRVKLSVIVAQAGKSS